MTMSILRRSFIAIVCVAEISAANADCAQWDASGKWTITPEGGKEMSLDLKQNGTAISGRASGAQDSKGTVEGTVKGDAFSIKITWTDKEGGPKTFIAKIATDGKLDGTSVVLDPLPKTIKWTSDHPLKCASAH